MNWILFRAVLWESLILDKINESLVSTDWSITTANLSGHLLGSVFLTDLTAIHPEYDTLSIEQSNVNLDFISTIFNKLTFDIIEIKGLETSVIPKIFSISNSNQNQHLLKFPFNINHFFISGSFPFQITDSLFMISGILAGELSGGDILKVNFSTLKLNIDEPNPFGVTMEKMMFRADEKGIFVKEFDGKIGQVPLTGSVRYLSDSSIVTGSISMKKFFKRKILTIIRSI